MAIIEKLLKGKFEIESLKDVCGAEKIIPFFNKYPVLGVKQKDFLDFKRVAELISNKAHLTLLGLEEIKKKKKIRNE